MQQEMYLEELRKLRDKWEPILSDVYAHKDTLKVIAMTEKDWQQLRAYADDIGASYYEYTNYKTGDKIGTLFTVPIVLRDAGKIELIYKEAAPLAGASSGGS